MLDVKWGRKSNVEIISLFKYESESVSCLVMSNSLRPHEL